MLFARLIFPQLFIVIATLSVTRYAAAETAPPQRPLPAITVIGILPIPDANLINAPTAGNIQSVSSQDLARSKAFDVTEYLERHVGSVTINDAQGNPLQRDLQIRGFVASPLLGLPQGISVYQDGVRINEPFGDTVNWALIPEAAIAELNVIPGSDPVFGLNTLGGALVLHTKNGYTHAGQSVELSMGSADRVVAHGAVGGSDANDIAYFLSASYLEDAGWRNFSPTRATQLFGDVRRHYGSGEISLSTTYVSTRLIGNGPTPESLLAIDRREIFTRPDLTQNNLFLLSLGGTYEINEASYLTMRAYQRSSDIDTFNGDNSDFEECETPPEFVCEPETDDEPALDRAGDPIEFNSQVDGATLNRSSTEQLGRGATIQWVTTERLLGHRNQFLFGASIDRNRSHFSSSTELGFLDATRLAVGSSQFVAEADVGLTATTHNVSAFFSDTWHASEHVAIALAGRWYEQDILLQDQLGTELNGDHMFNRFNPSLSAIANINNSTDGYLSYAQSSRVPSPVELTCADPDAPCRLPNAFLSDPPLKQVVAETIEVGVRGGWGSQEKKSGRWHLGIFQTESRDDIIFVSAGALTNQGYFTNIDATRRRGLEVSAATNKDSAKFNWSMHYTWLDATFQDNFRIASHHHPLAIDGEIDVAQGDKIPSVPQHIAKLGVDYEFIRGYSAAIDLNYTASQYARGDEANLLEAIPGHTVVNAQIAYQSNEAESVSLTLSINNLFNRSYATFATLGQSDEVLSTGLPAERFSTPAAPRSVWLSLRLVLN